MLCAVCRNDHWLDLPDPHPRQSVTTDGIVLAEPLAKAHCRHCGLVQRAQPVRAAGDASFYADRYDFYQRPAMREFERFRYQAYADWLLEHCPLPEPRSALEIGCGQGWLLEAMRERLPQTRWQGLEPSQQAVRAARRAGLEVTQGFADTAGSPDAGYDLVYSVNVIEHTEDPLAFLRAMRRLLRPGGIAAIVCPDGETLDSELLFADHLYTFARTHLQALCRRAGLQPLSAFRKHPVLYQFQLLYARADGVAGAAAVEPLPAAFGARRRDYFARWQGLDEALLERCGDAARLVCFGASETADLLRAYAPRTWRRVAAHLIDDTAALDQAGPGEVRGLPLYSLSGFSPATGDAIVLGVRPNHHRTLAARLQGLGLPVICFDDCLDID